MAKVEIYTKSWCGFSTRAKDHLDRKGVSYEEIDVTTNSIRELEMVMICWQLTPVAFWTGVYPA